MDSSLFMSGKNKKQPNLMFDKAVARCRVVKCSAEKVHLKDVWFWNISHTLFGLSNKR